MEARSLLSVASPLVGGTAPTIMTLGGDFKGSGPIGKNVHKKLVDVGFTIQFHGALDSTSADNTGNYTVLTNTKHGKKITTTPVAILSAEYTAPANVDFSLVDIRISKQAFAHGGELEVNGAPPSGIADPTDTLFLTGSTTFTISPNNRNPIHPS